MRRPVGGAAALASGIAEKKMRMRKNLLIWLVKVLMNSL
jgi:hypothetical protein